MKEIKELFPTDMRKYSQERSGWKHDRNLTELINVVVNPKMKRGIDLLIKSGKFPNRSEFIRFLIVKYFDEISKE